MEPIELGFPPEIGAANPASKQKGFFAYGVAAAVSRAVLRGDGRISEPGEIGAVVALPELGQANRQGVTVASRRRYGGPGTDGPRSRKAIRAP